MRHTINACSTASEIASRNYCAQVEASEKTLREIRDERNEKLRLAREAVAAHEAELARLRAAGPKVYVLLAGYDYEGDDIKGIYTTKTLAEEALSRFELGGTGHDKVFIAEHLLDEDNGLIES